MKSCALTFLANDRYFDWALLFLESVRSKNSKLPLYCIPHSGQTTKILGLRNAYGFEMLEEGLDRLDAFGRRLFPFNRHRANLRKYAALTLPVDEVAYFDVDMAVLIDPARLFGHIKPGEVDFVYFSTSPDWVYAARKMHVAQSLFPDMRLMSAGAFVTSRNAFTLDEVITTVEQNLELYRSLRRRNVFDQPVLNFVMHRLGKRCLHIRELDSSLVGMASSQNPNLQVTDGQTIDTTVSGDLLAVHWAGGAKKPLHQLARPRTWPLQRLRESLRSGALQRMQQSESRIG
jgi:hypothetical protein